MHLLKQSRFLKSTLALFTILLIITSCKPELLSDQYFSISGREFVDPQGREVIFHGVNIVNKNPETAFSDFMKQEDFDKMYKWGFNCVRLGFTWSGIEPEPGVFNEEYLKDLDGAIERAKKAGLYILLDMHQDLYGQEYSDGAPSWATLHEDKEHVKGEIWSDSYLISPAVQTAYDNFWQNTPASDGVGLIDHFAKVWQVLAERYVDETDIIGFDILNEPFMGSSANMVMPTMIGSYAQFIASQGQEVPPMEELGDMWGKVDSRLQILKTMEDTAVYKAVIDPASEMIKSFEEGPLSTMYQKVRDQIRQVNNHHIIFLEHNYFSNMGVPSAFKIPLDENGKPDSLIAYAPHGYDLVVDTDGVDEPANTRVELIFNQAYNNAVRMNLPMLVGEWGAFGGDRPGYLEAGKFIVSRFEKLQCSDTYWHYEKNAESRSFFGIQNRFYPAHINGSLISYSYDVDKGDFEAKWEESADIKAVNRFYVPNLKGIAKEEIKLEPASKFSIELVEGTDGGWLEVAAVGGERIINYK